MLDFSGEPGIGETGLLEHAGGMAVMRARGVESEAEIPFAGLHALLRPAFDRLDDLPAQGAALRGALGLAPGFESNRFLIGAAALGLLAAHAEQGLCWWSSTTRNGSTSRRSARSCSRRAGCSPTRWRC